MQATIKDIAKATGFSVATVSRVLSNKKGFFSEKTAAKVNQVAKELGYKKNMSATELVTKKAMSSPHLLIQPKLIFLIRLSREFKIKLMNLEKLLLSSMLVIVTHAPRKKHLRPHLNVQ